MSIVAIVGRPNVGKSTLFNRLGGIRSAIVDETSGVTRDRNYGKCEWNGKTFSIIDTGGYVRNSNDIFEEEIRKQVHLAIDEAQIILFVVDVTIGITDLDDAVAAILRKTEKKCFLVVNKVDNNSQLIDANEFYGLGLGDYFAISSINGTGTGELLDAIVENVKDDMPAVPEDDLPKFAIVGRPNVGKSSLINAFIGEERNIVTPISGTTRDSLYTRYTKFGHDFYLIDTAGLRKKGKVHENLEFYSVMRSIRSIESCDVCIIMLDATRGIEAQDMNILHLAIRNKKGIVVVVNKWDLIEKETSTSKEFENAIKEKIAPFKDVPVIFTSVTNKQRIFKTIETAVKVFESRKRKVATHKLNDVLLDLIKDTPPPSIKGKYIKVKYISQLPTPTPTFAFFCNLPQYVKDPYKRFLENQIRKNWDFSGVPLQLVFRKK